MFDELQGAVTKLDQAVEQAAQSEPLPPSLGRLSASKSTRSFGADTVISSVDLFHSIVMTLSGAGVVLSNVILQRSRARTSL
jgi:hypothetical protein